MKKKNRFPKIIILLIVFMFCNSCTVINPEKIKLIDNTDLSISTGVKITINETPRPLGSNLTTIEVYEKSANSLINNSFIKKHEFKWNSINNINLKNGDYKIITYYNYFGKKRLKTETIINVYNSLTNIVIEYPLFVTGKAKLKIY